MGGPDDSNYLQGEMERLKAESDRARIAFLRAELVAGFTFANLAETEHRAGEREAAERALAEAEKAYSMMLRFLSDPKHHVGDEERRELAAGLERLREKLDRLRT